MLSCTCLKNQRPAIGNAITTNKTNMTIDILNRVQKCSPMTPVAMPTITVKTSNASISVIIVPPTVIVTDLSFVVPNLLIIG